MSSKGWQARSGWQHSAVGDGGLSSQDQWKKPASRGKWKAVSNLVEELGTLLKEVLVIADELKTTGQADENTRAIIMRGLKRPRKIKEEEAAKELLEEIQDKQQQLEDEVWKEIEEYIISWEQERRMSSILNREDMATGNKALLQKRRTWRMTSQRPLLKFKNWAGKKSNISPGAGWNWTMAMAREVSQGLTSIRGVFW